MSPEERPAEKGGNQFPEPGNNLAAWHTLRLSRPRSSLHTHSLEQAPAARTLPGAGRRGWRLCAPQVRNLLDFS